MKEQTEGAELQPCLWDEAAQHRRVSAGEEGGALGSGMWVLEQLSDD